MPIPVRSKPNRSARARRNRNVPAMVARDLVPSRSRARGWMNQPCSCRPLLEELWAIAEPAQLAIPLLLVLIAQSVARGLVETLVAIGVEETTDYGHAPAVVPLEYLVGR